DWKTAIRERATSAREVLERHRWAVGLLDTRKSPGPATMRHFEDALRCLRTAGFSIEMTVHAYGVIYDYVYGFVLSTNQESQDDQSRQIIDLTKIEDYPYAHEIISEYMLSPNFDHIQQFNLGLDLILDALQQAHVTRSPTNPRTDGRRRLKSPAAK